MSSRGRTSVRTHNGVPYIGGRIQVDNLIRVIIYVTQQI
jgi:hypothetical protein